MRDKFFIYLIIISSTLFAGCVTQVKTDARAVGISRHAVAPDCHFLGSAYGFEVNSLNNEGSAKNRLINYTAGNGGNWVHITRIYEVNYGVKVEGNMFRCESDASEKADDCVNGNATFCNELAAIADQRKNYEGKFFFLLKGCKFGDSRSCDEIKKQESLEESLLKKCEKNKDGDACNAYGVNIGQRGISTAKADTYVSLGCKYGSQKACTNLEYLKKVNEQEKERQQSNQAAADRQREIDQKNAVLQEQKSQALINATGSVSDFMKSQNPSPPKKTKCKTVVRQGNGLDGAAAYSTTECD